MGIDYSGRLLDTAERLQREGTSVRMDSGKEISLQQFPGVHPDRAVFKQVSTVRTRDSRASKIAVCGRVAIKYRLIQNSLKWFENLACWFSFSFVVLSPKDDVGA